MGATTSKSKFKSVALKTPEKKKMNSPKNNSPKNNSPKNNSPKKKINYSHWSPVKKNKMNKWLSGGSWK